MPVKTPTAEFSRSYHTSTLFCLAAYGVRLLNKSLTKIKSLQMI